MWWTFRIFGAKKVYILDGGLPKWKAEGRPLEKGDAKRPPQKFNAEMNVGAVAMLADVRMALTDDSVQIVDARSAGALRRQGARAASRLALGHMPRSFNVPYDRLVENGRLAPRARIEAAFTDGRRRSRQADHHLLRLRRHRRDPDLRAGIASARSRKASTTARGRNGARGPTCRSNAASASKAGAKPPCS